MGASTLKQSPIISFTVPRLSRSAVITVAPWIGIIESFIVVIVVSFVSLVWLAAVYGAWVRGSDRHNPDSLALRRLNLRGLCLRAGARRVACAAPGRPEQHDHQEHQKHQRQGRDKGRGRADGVFVIVVIGPKWLLLVLNRHASHLLPAPYSFRGREAAALEATRRDGIV